MTVAISPSPFQRIVPPLQRCDAPNAGMVRWLRRHTAPVSSFLYRQTAASLARRALQLSDDLDRLTDAELLAAWGALSGRGHNSRDAQARRLALLRVAAHRTLGLRAHPVQLLAAQALSSRAAVEMATGEGKTLVTAMAAALQAAEDWPVHVITANDYLAARDAETVGPLFAALGLRAAAIEPGTAPEIRRSVYALPIIYASSKEIAFDHLRDRIAFGETTRLRLKLDRLLDPARAPVMRGLWSAIVDEADSVMIDEARTPLVISGPPDETPGALARAAVALVADMVEGQDFVIAREDGARPVLTATGEARVSRAASALGGVWRGERRTRELAERALYALHMLRRDVHYIVRDGKVQIVDDYTGRIMEDRLWSDGLHQMVEVKEELEPSAERQILGRLTFQRFFRRYRRLSGISGTLAEIGPELAEVYGLSLFRVPTHAPVRRLVKLACVLPDRTTKWAAMADCVARHRADGRPVLVGTRTVAGAEAASAALSAIGIPHRVLSAAQDADEAEIIAAAGRAGAVTVATNMAGRGTDIRPDADALAAGGLCVILCERHDARRIDRQLMGRCARQGEPGIVEILLSAEDEILRLSGQRRATVAAFDRAQAALEREHATMRRVLDRMEESLDDLAAFAGGLE